LFKSCIRRSSVPSLRAAKAKVVEEIKDVKVASGTLINHDYILGMARCRKENVHTPCSLVHMDIRKTEKYLFILIHTFLPFL